MSSCSKAPAAGLKSRVRPEGLKNSCRVGDIRGRGGWWGSVRTAGVGRQRPMVGGSDSRGSGSRAGFARLFARDTISG
jgi:hypothetical protein